MEIIRRNPEDNMLYFVCGKCRTEFKETIQEEEGQRDETLVRHLTYCPDVAMHYKQSEVLTNEVD